MTANTKIFERGVTSSKEEMNKAKNQSEKQSPCNTRKIIHIHVKKQQQNLNLTEVYKQQFYVKFSLSQKNLNLTHKIISAFYKLLSFDKLN